MKRRAPTDVGGYTLSVNRARCEISRLGFVPCSCLRAGLHGIVSEVTSANLSNQRPNVKRSAVHPPASNPAPLRRQRRRPLGSAMFSARVWREIARSLRLSGRELQIVRAMFDDRTESAMAADLGIAHRTVHTHFERLHHKLGVPDRVQLVLCLTQEFLRLGVLAHNPQRSPGHQRAARRI